MVRKTIIKKINSQVEYADVEANGIVFCGKCGKIYGSV